VGGLLLRSTRLGCGARRRRRLASPSLGFAFIGNNSQLEFNATAGHWGPNGLFNTSYDHNYFLGNTSTNYWEPTASTDDIQSITSPGGFSYEVWYSDTAAHNVIG
jgi:hypothetical protein